MEYDLERNKERVISFYELMFNAYEPRKAINLYAGSEYLQHSSGVATGKDASSNILNE